MEQLTPAVLHEKARAAHRQSDFSNEQKMCDALFDHPDMQGGDPLSLRWKSIALTQKSFSMFHEANAQLETNPDRAQKLRQDALEIAKKSVDYAAKLFESSTSSAHPDVPYSREMILSRAYWMQGELLAKTGDAVDAQSSMKSARRMGNEAVNYATSEEDVKLAKDFIEALDSSMVRIYLDAGMPSEAKQLGFLLLEKRLGKGDPRVATSMLNYSEACWAAGDSELSKFWADQALKTRKDDNEHALGDNEHAMDEHELAEKRKISLPWSKHKLDECEAMTKSIEVYQVKPTPHMTGSYLQDALETYGVSTPSERTRY